MQQHCRGQPKLKYVASLGFPGGSVVKNLPSNVEAPRLISGSEDLPEKEMAIPSSIFCLGKTPWTEEPGGLQALRSQRVWHGLVTKHARIASLRKGKRKERGQKPTKQEEDKNTTLYKDLKTKFHLTEPQIFTSLTLTRVSYLVKGIYF